MSAYDEAEIKGAVLLRVGLLLLKYIFSNELRARLPEILRLLPAPEQSALEYLRTVLFCLSKGTGKVKESEFAKALKTAFPQQGEMIMEYSIDAWIHQGEQKGRQEGRQEGVLALTLRQLRRRVGALEAGTEALIRALSVDQLEQLGEALLDFNTADDLTEWLRAHTVN